jgi:hypothetical protein
MTRPPGVRSADPKKFLSPVTAPFRNGQEKASLNQTENMKDMKMLKSILTPALIALSLAGAANAAQPAGDAQLSSMAGVPAGQYTTAELQQIIVAKQDHDTATVKFITSGQNRSTTAPVDASGQLAAYAGVQSGQYTAAELAQIIAARNDHDRDRVSYIVSGTNRASNGTAGSVSTGDAQIAANLGVDPTQFTPAELSAMWAAAHD